MLRIRETGTKGQAVARQPLSHFQQKQGSGGNDLSGPFLQDCPPIPGFLNLSPIDMLNWTVLCRAEGCPVQCMMFSSIPALYPLDANNTPPAPPRDNQKCLQMFTKCPLGAKLPLARNHCLTLKNHVSHRQDPSRGQSAVVYFRKGLDNVAGSLSPQALR